MTFSGLNGEAMVSLDADEEALVVLAVFTFECDGDSRGRVKRVAEEAKHPFYVHQSCKTDISITAKRV